MIAVIILFANYGTYVDVHIHVHTLSIINV
jgi:hypothetical protein